MGLFARLTDRLFEKFIAKMAKVAGWNIQQWQSGKPYYPDVSYKELVKRYSSWVYTCAEKNAISCAQIPLRLYAAKPARKTKALFPTLKVDRKQLEYLTKSPSTQNYVRKAEEIEEVVEHPFLDLLKTVNDFTNQFDLLEIMFLYNELCGNAYWYIVRDTKIGVPSEIWPLMTPFVRIVVDKKTFIARYEYVPFGEAEKHIIELENIVHFKHINPQDAYYGYGPLQAAVLAADLSTNMNLYETNLLKNSARPDMALVLPPESGTPTEDEVKRTERKWYQRFGGFKKAGKLVILHGGAELKQTSLTPKEMSFLQGRKATKEEIAAIFGVPLSLITTESVNRANAETGEYSYMKNTVLPRVRRAEQKLNEKLLPMYDERLFCAFDNPVPEDKEYRLKEVEIHLKTGYSSPNEERQEDGLDEVKWGKEPLLPMNIRPLSTEQPTPQAFVPPEKSIKSSRVLPPLNHPTNFVNEHFIKAAQAYYGMVAVEVLEGFDRDMIKAAKSPADDYMSAWFDMQKWNGELWTTCEPFVRYTMMSGGERALRQMTVDRLFDPMNPAVVRALTEHRFGSVQSINSTIVKQLREKLSEGMSEGESIPNLRNRVSEVFDGLSAYGAERIARTETIWAWNEGARQGYKQSGVVEKLQWLSSGDERSCDFCLDMDGQIIGINDSFFDKGDKWELNDSMLDFTYEKIDHPPLHCNCRCCIVPVLEGV